MTWKPEVEQIERRRAAARELGGEKAVAEQHARGRLTVRERIDRLIDPNSFHEQGPLAGHPPCFALSFFAQATSGPRQAQPTIRPSTRTR